MEDHENDLPMMANVSEILVYHFILDLKCELDKQELWGSITLYTKPRNSNKKALSSKIAEKETNDATKFQDDQLFSTVILNQSTDCSYSFSSHLSNSVSSCEIAFKGR